MISYWDSISLGVGKEGPVVFDILKPFRDVVGVGWSRKSSHE